VTGDFDSDGSVDLAVAGRDVVTVLLNDGRGGFSRSAELDAGGPVTSGSIALADLDADGAMDLAVVHATEDALVFFAGDGRGGFARVADLDAGAGPRTLGLGDFNGDGIADLAVGRQPGGGPPSLGILLGDGLGRFARIVDLDLKADPSQVVVADLDADGVPDLVVGSLSSASAVTFRGDGSGRFSRAGELEGRSAPTALAVADLNRDGALDVVLASEGVEVFLGEGRGTFARLSRSLTVGPSPSSLALADFNADGAVDIAVADRSADSVAVLVGDGLGGFGQVPGHAVGSRPTGLVVADFNADGLQDVATVDSAQDRLQVLLERAATGRASGAQPARRRLRRRPKRD
jgi:hypothetical protein